MSPLQSLGYPPTYITKMSACYFLLMQDSSPSVWLMVLQACSRTPVFWGVWSTISGVCPWLLHNSAARRGANSAVLIGRNPFCLGSELKMDSTAPFEQKHLYLAILCIMIKCLPKLPEFRRFTM